MEAYEILEKGADLLEKHGQCKGNFTDEEGRLCALGAMRKATWGTVYPAFYTVDWHDYLIAEQALKHYLNQERPQIDAPFAPSISAHNDGTNADDGTQKEFSYWNINLEAHPNMAEAMRLTAKQLRADGGVETSS